MKKRDKCKCGKLITWDTDATEVKCKYCGTKYIVDCDTVMVFWLKEDVDERKPYTTYPRY